MCEQKERKARHYTNLWTMTHIWQMEWGTKARLLFTPASNKSQVFFPGDVHKTHGRYSKKYGSFTVLLQFYFCLIKQDHYNSATISQQTYLQQIRPSCYLECDWHFHLTFLGDENGLSITARKEENLFSLLSLLLYLPSCLLLRKDWNLIKGPGEHICAHKTVSASVCV